MLAASNTRTPGSLLAQLCRMQQPRPRRIKQHLYLDSPLPAHAFASRSLQNLGNQMGIVVGWFLTAAKVLTFQKRCCQIACLSWQRELSFLAP